MTTSNSISRTPSRVSPSSTPTPGILAISSATLANANQTQSTQGKSADKRSKSGSQRRSQNASSASLYDPSSPAPSQAATQQPHSEPASALTAALTQQSSELAAASSPSSSPSKRTRSRRKQKPASDADEPADGQASSVDPAPDSPAPASRSARPQQGRGLSNANLTFTSTSQEEQPKTNTSLFSSNAPNPSTLSKSAPASSFLEGVQQSKKRRGGKQSHSNSSTNLQKENASANTPIRGSNSADEWEMPVARLITGNDSLTWQQQAALTRKSSQSSKKTNNKKEDTNVFKKQTPAPAQSSSTSNASNKSSGLSNVMAASAPSGQSSAQPSPALTWQQALLQRSAPATPSSLNLFEALEEGFSGARPASDHSRTRSSPVKASRPITRSQKKETQVKANLSDEDDLDKQLRDLVLSSVKPSQMAQPPSAKKVKPIPIKPSGKPNGEEVARNTEPEVTQAPISASPSTTRPIPMSSSSGSPTKSALYAGPKFHNSPHAAQLPTPRLAAFLNRNRESSPVTQSTTGAEVIFA